MSAAILETMALEEKKPTGIVRAGIVFGTLLTMMVQTLDSTIATVALPHMQGSLSASQDEIAWVITSYIVAVAIMTAPAGWLANRYGRKRILILGVAGFTLASVLTGFAQTLDEVVLCRFLQGAFGAPLIPLVQSLLLDSYEMKDSLKAMAWSAIGGTLGPILGPNLGGWITENWDWRWVFFINVPIGAICIVFLIGFAPETKTVRNQFDWFGFAALSLFIGALQLVLDRGSGQDWFGSTEIIIEASLAGLGLYLFVMHSLTTTKSFMDFGTLRDHNFACGTILIFIFNGLSITVLVLLPSFLQEVLGDPVGLSGSLMTPRAIGTGLVMFAVGRFGSRVDPRLMTTVGLIVLAYSMYWMSAWSLAVSSSDVAFNGFIQGVGIGSAAVPMQGAAFSGISPERRNGAVSIYALGRNFGQSIGVSAIMALLVRNSQVNHADLARFATPFNHALQTASVLRHWNPDHLATRAALDAEVGRQAILVAYLDDFKLLMYLTLLVIPIVLSVHVPKKIIRYSNTGRIDDNVQIELKQPPGHAR